MAKTERPPRSAGVKGRTGPATPAAHTPRFELLAIAVMTSLILAALLTQDLLPAGIGTGIPVAGEIADRSYKAPKDIRIVDEGATEEERRKASEQAPVVYDFDEGRLVTVRDRIRAAFRAGREALAAASGSEAAPVAPEEAFQNALGESYAVPESARHFFAETGFLAEHEGRLIRLMAPALGRMIVDDRSELERHSEKRSIVVRELGSGTERRLESRSRMLTLDDTRRLLRDDVARLVPAEAEAAMAERRALLATAETFVRASLKFNLRATDEKRKAAEEGVKPVVVSLRKGEIVVRDGEPITDRHVLILHGIRAQERTSSRVERFIGVAGLAFALVFLVWRFGRASIQRFPRDSKDARFMLATLVGMSMGTGLGIFLCDAVAENPALSSWIGHSPTALYYGIPIAAAAMLVRLVHNAETTALFVLPVSLLAGLQVGGDLSFAIYALVGSLTAAGAIGRVMQRGTLLRAGVRVGVVNAIVIVALGLLGVELHPVTLLISVSLGFVAGPIAAMFATALAPVVESAFSYTTDIKLVELANREQPLLRDLEFRAPGTYHHSMMVGHLAEKAAEAIGANALLAKVAGYYHDVGKMRRPHFFVENVTVHRGENRHEKISPSMSARIIQAHVKDGLEYGERYKLAPPIMRGIAQHHGTSVIRFFYEKAKELVDREKGEVVEEHDYRYPGPRPQTREAGILMLADSVEAASRTLADTSKARVQQLVQRIINNYFRDGQLDECSLTLRDLHAIARSFIETLSAIRHERIDYPEATDAAGRKLDEGADEGVVERLEPGKKDRSERSAEKREPDIKRLGLH